MGDCSFLCSLRSFQPWSTRDLVVPLFGSYDAKVQPFFFFTVHSCTKGRPSFQARDKEGLLFSLTTISCHSLKTDDHAQASYPPPSSKSMMVILVEPSP
jgi:hypothetical protein